MSNLIKSAGNNPGSRDQSLRQLESALRIEVIRGVGIVGPSGLDYEPAYI